MQLIDVHGSNEQKEGIWRVLRTYGIFPIQFDLADRERLHLLIGGVEGGTDIIDRARNSRSNVIWIQPPLRDTAHFHLNARHVFSEEICRPPARGIFRCGDFVPATRHGLRRLGTGIEFDSSDLRPALLNGYGQAEAAVQRLGEIEVLWVGSDLVDEIVRYRQGDPDIPRPEIEYDLNKFSCERPQYRFEKILNPERKFLPEADLWGWWLVNKIREFCDLDVCVWPLPFGKKAVILLSGDEDECDPALIEEQMRLVGDQKLPFTMFMTQKSRLDEAALKKYRDMGVECELHPVVDNDPDNYEADLALHMRWFETRFGRRARAVRNHMHLHKGYIDYALAWEKEGLAMDFNYPGADGALLNGSFLPMQYRAADGRWTRNFSQITLFSDFLFSSLSMKEALNRIKAALKIMGDFPGAAVFNLHPFNIEMTSPFFRKASKLLRGANNLLMDIPGWIDFVKARNSISFSAETGTNGKRILNIQIPDTVSGLTLWLREGKRLKGPFTKAPGGFLNRLNLWTSQTLVSGACSVEIVD